MDEPNGAVALKRAMNYALQNGEITRGEYDQIVADLNEIRSTTAAAVEAAEAFVRIYEAFKVDAPKRLHTPDLCARSVIGGFKYSALLHRTVAFLREWLMAPSEHPSERVLFQRMIDSIPSHPKVPHFLSPEFPISERPPAEKGRTPGEVEQAFMAGWHQRFLDIFNEASNAGFPCAFTVALDDGANASGTFIPDNASPNAVALLELLRPALEQGWVPVPPEAVAKMEDHKTELPNHRVTVGEA